MSHVKYFLKGSKAVQKPVTKEEYNSTYQLNVLLRSFLLYREQTDKSLRDESKKCSKEVMKAKARKEMDL